MKRIRLANRKLGSFIEWIDDDAGMRLAKAYRAANARYKHKPITPILQMLPDKVE